MYALGPALLIYVTRLMYAVAAHCQEPTQIGSQTGNVVMARRANRVPVTRPKNDVFLDLLISYLSMLLSGLQ